MRSNAYVAVLASFLVVLLAFATTSALAETMTKPTMEHSGTTGQYKDKPAGQAETEFSGEAKTGAFQKEKEKTLKEREIKAGKKGAESPVPRTGVSGEVKSKPKGEFRGDVRTVPEEQSSREIRGKMERAPRGEVKKAPEARIPGQQRTAQQVKGGEAVVIRVDRPKNCLRVRSGPGSSYDEIGCAAKGDRLILTGVFSEDRRWAQLDNNGWVFFRQLRTELKPPPAMASEGSFAQPAGAGAAKKKYRRGHKRFHGYGYGCGGYYTYPYGGYYTYPSYYYGSSSFGWSPGYSFGFGFPGFAFGRF